MVYKLPQYQLPGFESISLSVKEKTFKIDLQDGDCYRHLGFLIRTISGQQQHLLQWLQALGAQEMQWAQALEKGP